MCFAIVERYSECRCVHNKRDVVPCPNEGKAAHNVREVAETVGKRCQYHESEHQRIIDQRRRHSIDADERLLAQHRSLFGAKPSDVEREGGREKKRKSRQEQILPSRTIRNEHKLSSFEADSGTNAQELDRGMTDRRASPQWTRWVPSTFVALSMVTGFIPQPPVDSDAVSIACTIAYVIFATVFVLFGIASVFGAIFDMLGLMRQLWWSVFGPPEKIQSAPHHPEHGITAYDRRMLFRRKGDEKSSKDPLSDARYGHVHVHNAAVGNVGVQLEHVAKTKVLEHQAQLLHAGCDAHADAKATNEYQKVDDPSAKTQTQDTLELVEQRNTERKEHDDFLMTNITNDSGPLEKPDPAVSLGSWPEKRSLAASTEDPSDLNRSDLALQYEPRETYPLATISRQPTSVPLSRLNEGDVSDSLVTTSQREVPTDKSDNALATAHNIAIPLQARENLGDNCGLKAVPSLCDSAVDQYLTSIADWEQAFVNAMLYRDLSALKVHLVDQIVEQSISSCTGSSRLQGETSSCQEGTTFGTSRGGYPQKASKKRQREGGKDPGDDGNGSGDDDDDGDDDEQRRKKKVGPGDDKTPRRRLRCPFYLNNPRKYETTQACSSGMGFEDLSRLRLHLKRVHTAPLRCVRCQTKMESKAKLKEHMRREQGCEIVPESHDDEISQEQWDEIDSLPRFASGNRGIEEKYRQLQGILFGEDAPRHSPFERSFIMPELERELASAIHEVLAQKFVEILPAITAQLPEILKACKARLGGSLYSSTSSSSSSCLESRGSLQDGEASGSATSSDSIDIAPVTEAEAGSIEKPSITGGICRGCLSRMKEAPSINPVEIENNENSERALQSGLEGLTDWTHTLMAWYPQLPNHVSAMSDDNMEPSQCNNPWPSATNLHATDGQGPSVLPQQLVPHTVDDVYESSDHDNFEAARRLDILPNHHNPREFSLDSKVTGLDPPRSRSSLDFTPGEFYQEKATSSEPSLDLDLNLDLDIDLDLPKDFPVDLAALGAESELPDDIFTT